jgi:hypothetical protein
MIIRDFLDFFADYTRSNADVDARFRGLRKEGFLSGARGRHSPDITAQQAALFLLSMVATRAVEGASVGLGLSHLQAVHRKADTAETNPTLIDYLAELIAAPGRTAAQGIVQIEISENPLYARVIFKDGNTILFTNDEDTHRSIQQKPELYDVALSGLFRRLAVFSGYFIDMLAVKIKDRGE